ncbi:MAG: beta-galactosidase [Nocardioidaceae bacterium]
MTARRTGMPRIAYGGDYNPEQWSRSTWDEDVRLMREAGVNLVSLGIFSWGLLESAPGEYDFSWLDDVIELLAEHDIAVDLSTGTAATPPWLAHHHPETLPVDSQGRTLCPGSRQSWCPSSPVYREYAARLVEQLGARYGDHPAVCLWHVGNEYGCHNVHCYCDVSAQDFRRWLEERYGDIDTLNDAWTTTFWSQHYTDFAQILPPRATPAFHNPGQLLDFKRFSSDASMACFTMERDILHRLSPDVPVTTNFMVTRAFDGLDYWRWAQEVDVVSNDHYLESADPQSHIELAFSADLTRGLAGGAPWILMEHSTSAVNWQPRNRAKQPAEMTRNSMQHVARGADGVMFFQWRASRGGAEKFHSAMLPHGGTDTLVWRETTRLGQTLGSLSGLPDAQSSAEVAIVFDWESGWAVDSPAHPSVDVRYRAIAQSVYAGLWRGGVGVDFLPPGADLRPYKLVVAPCLHMLAPSEADNLDTYARGGGGLLVTYFSGIVDRNDQVVTGGYPGLLATTLGLVVEEFFPLQESETLTLDDGSEGATWSELIKPRGCDVVRSFASGPVAGAPAVTVNQRGEGSAWYAGTQLSAPGMDHLVSTVCKASGVRWAAASGVERRMRHTESADFTFVINHSDRDQTVAVTGRRTDDDSEVRAGDLVSAGETLVVRSEPRREG